MSLNGVLQDFSLNDVLTLLAGTQKTGALRLERLGETGSVYFDRGLVYYATSRRADHLGADMVAAGVLDADTWERVSREPGIAEHAVAAGAAPVRLQEFLEDRIGEAFFSLFRWADGAFRFQQDGMHPIGPWLHLPPGPLISEAQRRLDEWATMCERVPTLAHRVRLRADLGDQAEVTLRASEWRVLVAIGEGASAQVVGERLGCGDFQAMRELYQLVVADLVRVEDPIPVENVLTVEALDRDPAEVAALRLAPPAMPVPDPPAETPATADIAVARDEPEEGDEESEPDIGAILEELGADPAPFGSALRPASEEEARLYPAVDVVPADAPGELPDVEPASARDQLFVAEDAGLAPRYGHDVEASEPGWDDHAPTTRHPAIVLPGREEAADAGGPGSVAAFAREFSRIMSDSKRRQ